ncbi:uncharacterized protein LOC129728674 [Wyeomyia smithii]|uniref:uncharacterized protein LOC129728674 n=1 Tax=Wyeomyia smithii TaxID=174621 RepID=UPI002467F295|nr:uncharacterized protein LOC129728674 [Wyeomyia smithii]
MRVDFLTDEELDHELISRAVNISPSLDKPRKRKWLKEQLKKEKEGSSDKCLRILGDPNQELKQSLTDSRGSPNLHGQIQNTIVELAENLETVFGNNIVSQMIPNDPVPTDENLDSTDSPDLTDDERIDSRAIEFNKDDWARFYALQARITELETELARVKVTKNAVTQTVNDEEEIADGLRPDSHKINPFPFSRNHHPVSIGPDNTIPNQNSNPILRQTVPDNPHILQSSLHHPYYPYFSNPNSFSVSAYPHFSNIPEYPVRSSIPNPAQYSSAMPNLPHPNPNLPSMPNRHTLPVSKWNVAKYGGDDQGWKLNEFLELVHALAQAEHVSETEIFESAIHLFANSALKWYMTQRATGRLLNWQHLVFELKRTFMHPELDAWIKKKIYHRLQQRNESFHEFYFEVEKLFRTMNVQIPEYEKLQILLQNIRPDYKRALAFTPIVDLFSLVSAAQKLDSINFSSYHKFLGNERTVQIVEDTSSKSKKKDKQQPQTQKSIAQAAVSSQPGHIKQYPTSPAQSNSRFNQSSKNNQQTVNSQEKPNSSNSSSRPEPIAGPSGPQKLFNLENLVNAHVPPASNTCFNCGRAGHHMAMCRQQRNIFSSNPPPFWIPSNDASHLDTSETLHISYPVANDNRPYVNIKIYEYSLHALLDSGSNYTLISETVYSKLSNKKLQQPFKRVTLRSASGDELNILGQAQLPFNFKGSIKMIPTLVIKNLSINCICGMDFWNRFKIQPIMQKKIKETLLTTIDETSNQASASILNETEIAAIENVKKMFLPAREGELTLAKGAEHKIVLGEEWKNKPPVRQFPYVMSPKTQELVAVELNRLLDLGIIERSSSDWSLNCVPVIKPNKVRLCLDARKINERTVRDAYPLPHPGRILGQLPEARYLSTIDLSEAFLQVPLEKQSRKYTAFSVQGKGLFQYTRMPFGLINSPATLARLMDKVLGHGVLEPHVFVYLDDIVVVTETFEQHLRLLKEIAHRLREANLSINLEKSKFGVSEIPFLGYLLSVNGLSVNPDKIRPIVEYERPNTITKLRRFLGMANYYRRFIPGFSGVTSALTDLLQSKTKNIQWNNAAEEAFCVIKELLISSPVLGSPDFSREFTIQTDASDVAIAGVLTQEHEGEERVISYYSHKLTTPQKNYHAAEKEALAAILSIDAFRGYVEGYHFTLITDSSALTHILTTKWKVGSRCSRWALNLQQFDMSVRHRKGKENIVPDALSRSIAAVTDFPWYTNMLDKVSNRPDDFVDFKVDGSKLFKFVSIPEIHDSRFEWKQIPPPSDIETILKRCHDDVFHPGYEKTVGRIRQRYYWPKMANEVRKYVQQCGVCKEVKATSVPVVPEMGKMKIATRPCRRGNQHLLVVCDYFSKWVMIHPTKNVSSAPMCTVLRDQWFLRNSVPEIIISDNGSSFVSKEFKSLLDRFQITHWLNTRYHSQANPVERVNRTINAAIRTYVREDQRLWDTRVSEIEMALNTSVHTSTSFTPFFITHGHEFFEAGIDHKLERTNEKLTPEQLHERREKMFNRIFETVRKNLEKAHASSQHRYNLRSRRFAKSFVEGQLVYRKNMKPSSAANNYNSKYGPQYLPCRVKAKLGSSSYELEDLTGKSLGVWPAVHLKPG